ncbi:hypothetical protein [Emticicia sp. TH156]|uniref:hypothetical protein n=1 Tax=Emticicia sp. TH156 TaxID=2067454 RepID=UPI000C766857|nr:hypothetical protein [Emticicia sp. TH156]PLK44960.1 hypothetical protein C0V77_06860 [Emticicia sp. TH156]
MNTYENSYIFEWIDSLISQILDPHRKDFLILSEEQMAELTIKIQQENIRLKSLIRHQLFSLTNQLKKQVLISQYYSALTLLLNQVLHYRKDNPFQQNAMEQAVYLIQSSLEELLSFIETRYFILIDPEVQVSATCYEAIQKEMKVRVQALTNRLDPEYLKDASLRVILQRLYRFIEGRLPPGKVTYRTVFYKKALLKGLEELQWKKNEPEDFSELDKLLIYLNFNSKAYINLLITYFKGNGWESRTVVEKISRLQFFHKAFKQIHPKPKIILNPQYYGLQTIINNWFEQEITYLKETLHLPVSPSTAIGGLQDTLPKVKQKVLCNLSSDQLALILRAADEAKILVAHSMSEVFKTIVPHLSTPHKEELSYNAMRVRTYNVEDRDKEIAIAMLETIIKKIKTF